MHFNPDTQEAFAQAYTRLGNATHALMLVFGVERTARMKPHTLRARASELLNDYRVAKRIEELKAEIKASGGILPRYRKRTYRSDLMSKTEKESQNKEQWQPTFAKELLAVHQQIARLKQKYRRKMGKKTVRD